MLGKTIHLHEGTSGSSTVVLIRSCTVSAEEGHVTLFYEMEVSELRNYGFQDYWMREALVVGNKIVYLGSTT